MAAVILEPPKNKHIHLRWLKNLNAQHWTPDFSYYNLLSFSPISLSRNVIFSIAQANTLFSSLTLFLVSHVLYYMELLLLYKDVNMIFSFTCWVYLQYFQFQNIHDDHVGRLLITRGKISDQYTVLRVHGFPGGPVGEESACNAGDTGSVSGSGRSPGEGNGSPL